MDANLLCKLDDLLKILLIKPLYPGVKMMREESNINPIKKFELYWTKNYVLKILELEQDCILKIFLNIIKEFNLAEHYNILNQKHIELYIKLYINFFKNQSICLENCFKYSLENHRGLQVVATCEIEEKTIIQGVFGIYKPLRNEHESMLKDDQQFSILINSSRKSCVFLGTIAFINHHCKPNCEYVSSNPSYVKLRSLKKIQKGEELFVYYGDNYFDSDNKNCECSFCKPIDTIKISNEAPNNELDTNLEVLNDELDSSQKASHDEFNSTLETINDELDSTQNASYDQLNSTLEADFFGFENSTTNEDISFQSELYLYKEKNKRRTTDSIQTDKILKVILPKISLEDYKKSMTDNYKNDTPKQKRPFCPFCKKFKSRFSDHIQSVHSNEKDVQKLMKCKDKKLRSAILSNLRSKGYGMYFEITGTMIPVKKPKKNASNVEKVQCPTCQGHYSKSTIWKHKKIHLYYRT